MKKTSALKKIQPDLRRGLYVHIPFCLKKCHYCDFVITTKRDPQTRRKFFNALAAEIQHSIQQYGPLTFDTLYFGGGTPSALEADEFHEIYELLTRSFKFKKNIEFTVEVNPGDVNEDKVNAYFNAGVNRVSLGVQAMQAELLQDMNRPHGIMEVEKTVEMLHGKSIKNLSMDIILNLPHQTIQDVDRTVENLLLLKPNQVSVYDLDVHENTVYGQRRRDGKLKLSSEDIHAEMSKRVKQRLEAFGMVHYELTNFAQAGYESSHNLIYWNNQPYLGLGPGAFSYMDGIRYQMSKSVNSYFKKAEEGNWKPEIEDHLSPEEIEKEDFLTGIRLQQGIDMRRLSLIKDKVEMLAKTYLEEGMLEKDEFRLKFTDQGKPLAEWMLQRFARV